jgi:hypothetical protein
MAAVLRLSAYDHVTRTVMMGRSMPLSGPVGLSADVALLEAAAGLLESVARWRKLTFSLASLKSKLEALAVSPSCPHQPKQNTQLYTHPGVPYSHQLSSTSSWGPV